MPYPVSYSAKPQKLVQRLARGVARAEARTQLATLLTEPTLKSLPGPNATQPLQPGETPGPDSVLAWFCDVKLVGQDVHVRDALVAVQARGHIGHVGDPVTVLKDPTGAYMVLSRAERVTDFRSVIAYTTRELQVGFIRGLRLSGSDVVTAFYQYTSNPNAVVTATRNGRQQAGLNRGLSAFGSGGAPVTSWTTQVYYESVRFGDLDWGTDKFGVKWLVKTGPFGTTRTKVQP